MNASRGNLTLVMVSGIFTAPNFMHEFGGKLRERCEDAGFLVRDMRFVMPYGDWSAVRLKQAAEAAADVLFPSFGGKRTLAGLALHIGGEGEFALVGHSGGGVAALHAAYKLLRLGAPVRAVVMIGSPKTAVPEALRPLTAFLYAGGPGFRSRDPVSRIGSFLGRPPARMQPLEIKGGHRDYFRSRPPFIAPSGESNLELTADAAFHWILTASSTS